ncbi:MAG: SRPBCC family protein [Nitrosopumilus sp.]|nr:SRPBCC family protein [Nitrosopumilus sp.]
MLVSNTTKINANSEKIWNTLRSFDKVERYMPIVTKTTVEGIGQGAKRICDVNMGTQSFKIQETLEVVDDPNHSLIVSIDDGPIQMRGMKFTFKVKKLEEKGSEVTISTNVENPMAAAFSDSIFALMGTGLKKLHEI